MNQEKITVKKENVFANIGQFLGDLYNRVNELRVEEEDENQVFINIINKAHEEWRNAEQLFQNVSDPDLIDHAIYTVEAARTRYVYLLKKAKAEGIKINF